MLIGAEGPCNVDPFLDLPDVPDPAGAGEVATAQRQDLRLASAQLGAARQVEGDAYLDYVPSLVANANAFVQAPPTISSPLLGWQVQVALVVPFYDGGLREGAHQVARSLRQQAEVGLVFARRTARSEVRVSFAAVRLATAALEAAGRAAERAHESVALATEAYRAGNINNLVVVDAERRARDADTDAIMAEDGVRQARLDLLTAAGRFP